MRAANLFSVLFLLASASAGADMYKWTGADGTPQFGQYPPAGVQAERLKPAPAPRSTSAPPSAQEQLKVLNQRLEAQNEEKAKAQAQREEAERRQINCENARNNLQRLSSGGNRMVQMPDGSYQRLDQDLKQKQLETNRKAVKTFCK